MKTLPFLLSLIFLTVIVNLSPAQSPGSFTYQAVIRNNTGTPIAETEIAIRISLLQGTTSGTLSYMETHNVQTNKYGLVNLNIGEGTVVSGNIDEIDWATGPYFIKIEIDLSGGSNYAEISTTQILSVPYALYAKTAGNFDYENLTNKPPIPVINDYDITDTSLWSSSKTNSELGNKVSVSDDQTIYGIKTFDTIINAKGGINANNNRIANVASPINANDAVNKATLDALLLRIERLERYVFDSLKEVWLTDSTGKTYDIEGNEYNFKKIGNQIWMTDNLKTTKYSNGDIIGTTDPVNKNISDEINPKYQWVYGGDSANLIPYGRLYTYYAITDSRNVCPSGWHVPESSEFNALIDRINGSNIAGGKLKEDGYDHWLSPNTDATNETGFSALPGGYRSHAGGNGIAGSPSMGYYGYYWTSTSLDDSYAESKRFENGTGSVGDHTTEKNDGVSVRCLKDE